MIFFTKIINFIIVFLFFLLRDIYRENYFIILYLKENCNYSLSYFNLKNYFYYYYYYFIRDFFY